MLKALLIRLIGVSFLTAAFEAVLPDNSVSASAKRVFLLIETLIVIEPIAQLLLGLR